jgi:hypothetical protein
MSLFSPSISTKDLKFALQELRSQNWIRVKGCNEQFSILFLPKDQAEVHVKIPTKSGEDYEVPQSLIDDLKAEFPTLDIIDVLHQVRLWGLKQSAQRRKTERGMKKHIYSFCANSIKAFTAYTSTSTPNSRGLKTQKSNCVKPVSQSTAKGSGNVETGLNHIANLKNGSLYAG